jgi:hypothetical protein
MKRVLSIAVCLGLAAVARAQPEPSTGTPPAPAASEPAAPAPAAAPTVPAPVTPAAAPVVAELKQADAPAASAAPSTTILIVPGAPVVPAAPRPSVLRIHPSYRPTRAPRPDSAYARSRRVGKPRTFGGRVALQAGGVLTWPSDPGYDVFDDEGPQRGYDLAASYDLLRPLPELALSLGASVRGTRGESSDGQLALRGLVGTLDLSARYALIPVLPVFARVGVGMARANLVLAPDDAALARHDDTDRGFAAELGAGVVLCTAPGWLESPSGRFAQLSFGLSAEAGYRFGQALAPRIARSSELGVAQRSAQLGGLDVATPYLRLLGTLRF